MKSVLEQKISANYTNSEKLLKVIRKHDSEVFLNNVFKLIDEFTDQKSEKEMIALASTILTKLNDVLLKIEDEDERKMVKYAITDIFKIDIRSVSKNLSPNFIPSLIRAC